MRFLKTSELYSLKLTWVYLYALLTSFCLIILYPIIWSYSKPHAVIREQSLSFSYWNRDITCAWDRRNPVNSSEQWSAIGIYYCTIRINSSMGHQCLMHSLGMNSTDTIQVLCLKFNEVFVTHQQQRTRKIDRLFPLCTRHLQLSFHLEMILTD